MDKNRTLSIRIISAAEGLGLRRFLTFDIRAKYAPPRVFGALLRFIYVFPIPVERLLTFGWSELKAAYNGVYMFIIVLQIRLILLHFIHSFVIRTFYNSNRSKEIKKEHKSYELYLQTVRID